MKSKIKMMNLHDTEECAEIAHDIWAHWMQYFFSQCGEEISTNGDEIGNTGRLIIPKDKVERWKRQASTPYADLTEKEKDSDREIAYEFFKIPRPRICEKCMFWAWHESDTNPQGSGMACAKALNWRKIDQTCKKFKAL